MYVFTFIFYIKYYKMGSAGKIIFYVIIYFVMHFVRAQSDPSIDGLDLKVEDRIPVTKNCDLNGEIVYRYR